LLVRRQGGGLRDALRIPGRARESQGGAETFEKYVDWKKIGKNGGFMSFIGKKLEKLENDLEKIDVEKKHIRFFARKQGKVGIYPQKSGFHQLKLGCV
jgi:hypothetical protein